MRLAPRSVRVRLTLWYALALVAIVCLFSVGIYLLVDARLYREIDRELTRKLSTVEHIYRDEPNELTELEPHGSAGHFQVFEDGKILHATNGWTEAGLAKGLGNPNAST